MKQIIENIIITILALWVVASVVDFVICGQLALHTSTELQEWNVGLIVYNWIK